MKLLKLAAALLCASSLSAYASTSNVTATLTDPDGVVWSNCTWTAIVNSPVPPTISGVPVPNASTRANGACNASGVTTATILDTGSVQQNGVTWTFTIQPNASVPPSVVSGVSVTGATVNLSTVLSAGLRAPRFGAGPNAYGYADGEINSSSLGNTYFNTGTACGSPGMRQLSLAGWTCGGGGGVSATTDLVMTKLNTLLGTGVVKAAYLHGNCTTPYKDYSGNGNDGAVIAGIAQPSCSNQGLKYFDSVVGNAWSIPTSVSTTALSYATRICPYTSVMPGNNGSTNGAFLESGTTGGLIFSFLGKATNVADAYAPTIGSTSVYNTTSSSENLIGCTTDVFNIGTNASTDPDQIFVNGVQPAYTNQGASSAFRAIGTAQIGGSTALGSGSWFFGIETGTIAFTRKLTASEVQGVTQILRDYSAQNGSLDIPLATNSNIPSIVCGVDSITFGQGVTNSYCTAALLTGLNETVNITHAPAVQSQTMAAASSRIVPIFQPFFANAAPHNTAILFGCTNDLGGAACAPVMGSGATQLKRLGWKIIAIPMFDRTGNDAGKNTFNTAFRAQCAAFADGCLGDSDPNLYADGASTNTTYFQSDGTHPTATGQGLLAAYVVNAYNKLYGSTESNYNNTSAATYQMTAADSFLRVGATSTVTLPNCLGYTGRWKVKVDEAFTVTLKTATSAQTIDGTDYSSTGLSLAGGTANTFGVVLGLTTAGGCTWEKL